jgi:nicotinamide mononucleotide adenylyltransferase
LDIPFEIKYIPDNLDNDIWTKDLISNYFEGDLVYSGNSLVQELLTGAGLEVRIPPPIENPSGTEIREMMIKGEKWGAFVPEGSQKVIGEIAGEIRVKLMGSQKMEE